jgi:glycosyltransferase involved in cell wall biosynthesis
LDLEFVVVGDTTGDEALLATGHVFIVGTYRPGEVVELIRRQKASLGFVPSVWPETWSLTLTELWQAGLPVAAFDLGTPAERIRKRGLGLVLPWGLPAAAINNALLAAIGHSGHE